MTERLVDEFLMESVPHADAVPAAGSGKPKAWLLITLLAVAAGLLAAGILLVGGLLPLGIGLIVGGVLVLLADMLLYIKGLAIVPTAAGMSPRAGQLQARLQEIFAEYEIVSTDMLAAMRGLKGSVEALTALRAEKAAYDEETKALLEREQACEETLTAGLQAYCLDEKTWKEAGRDALAYSRAVRRAQEKRTSAEVFRAQYGLIEEPQAVLGYSERKAAHRALQERLRNLRAQTENLEREVAELPRLCRRLEEETEKLSEYRRERMRTEMAIAALRQADEGLKERYLTPMQNSFLRYAKKLGAEWAEKVVIGENLEVRFEAQGALRREENLSDGQRALTALCMRLALMENLHKGELPFCILDDPFVHLDGTHFAEVASGVRALSQEMQILYFTCHEARKI